jgi:uncharacterized membrane protein YphA (DoxX/SURF4 family)
MRDWLLLLLRVATGTALAVYVGHDLVFDDAFREATAEQLKEAGIPASSLLASLQGIVTFFAALFLAAGFFTRQSSILLFLALAASSALLLLSFGHEPQDLFRFYRDSGPANGWYLLCTLILFIMGPGNISFDAGRRASQSD